MAKNFHYRLYQRQLRGLPDLLNNPLYIGIASDFFRLIRATNDPQHLKFFLDGYASDLRKEHDFVNTAREAKTLESPLNVAISMRKYDIVRCLLDNGADVDVASGCMYQSPLHKAVETNWDQLVKELLARGAKINNRDQKGHTPLFAAAKLNRVDMMELLTQENADFTLTDEYGHSLLHVALIHRCRAAVRFCIHKLNGRPSNQLWADLIYPCSDDDDNRLLQLDILLSEYMQVSAFNVDSIKLDGNTMLHEAVRKNRAEIVGILLKWGANLYEMNSKGQRVFEVAFGNDCTSWRVIDRLLDYPFDASRRVPANGMRIIDRVMEAQAIDANRKGVFLQQQMQLDGLKLLTFC